MSDEQQNTHQDPAEQYKVDEAVETQAQEEPPARYPAPEYVGTPSVELTPDAPPGVDPQPQGVNDEPAPREENTGDSES